MWPDKLVKKAAIVVENSGCELVTIGGNYISVAEHPKTSVTTHSLLFAQGTLLLCTIVWVILG